MDFLTIMVVYGDMIALVASCENDYIRCSKDLSLFLYSVRSYKLDPRFLPLSRFSP